MTGILLYLVLIPAAWFICLTCAWTDESLPCPMITCDQPAYDFGVLKTEDTVTHSFIIWNRGAIPLRINRVRGCCGASATIQNMTVPPDTNTILDVKFSLYGRRGKQEKAIYVMSDDLVDSTYRLTLIGTVVVPVDVEPASVDFGRIGTNAVVERQVRIVCQTGFAFRITNITVTVPYLTVTCESASIMNHDLRVRTVPPLPPNGAQGIIQVFTDSAKYKYRQIDIPVVSIGTAGINVVPREILFSTNETAEPTTRYLALRSRDDQPFKVLNVLAPQTSVKTVITPFGNHGYRIELKNIMPGEDLDGEVVVITTDLESDKKITIPFRLVSPDGKQKE